MTLTDFLTAHSLDVLSIIWTRGSKRLRQIVSERIRKQCELDLVKDWEHFTDEQIVRLQNYENNDQPWLLLQIFNDQDTNGDGESRFTVTNRKYIFALFWLSVFIITFALVYIVAVTWIPIPPENVNNTQLVLGFVLGTLLTTIINFLFGASMQNTNVRTFTGTQYSNNANLMRNNLLTGLRNPNRNINHINDIPPIQNDNPLSMMGQSSNDLDDAEQEVYNNCPEAYTDQPTISPRKPQPGDAYIPPEPKMDGSLKPGNVPINDFDDDLGNPPPHL